MSPAAASPESPILDPVGRLALRFQEVLTVVVRIRANRQATTDPAVFRDHIKQLLLAADTGARQDGYDSARVRSATYACVAFIDESVLNSSQAMFAGWARQPLQEEIFEHHRAGEVFFDNLRELLAEPDTRELADVLEVYLLCLQLGFRGRYVTAESAELRNLIAHATERIRGMRGEARPISPDWRPRADEVRARSDPWIRRLGVIAAGTFLLAIILFVAFRFLVLGPLTSDVVERANEVVETSGGQAPASPAEENPQGGT